VNVNENGTGERGQPAIVVRDLTRVHRGGGGSEPVLANDGLTFTVPRGEVFGLLGPNGAGKTTLVSQLLGLVRPTSGSITVAGIDVVTDPDAVKAVTGYLPQTGLAMRMVEVRRALHYTGRLRGQSEQQAKDQTAELLEELGLDSVANRYVNRLSGGMMRLVNFGMALMGRPALLILDEPTNELDPHNRRLIWDVVARRSAVEGSTVVLVTHNVLEAERAVHRVAVLHAGQISALGTPGELKARLGDLARLELFVKDGADLAAPALASLAEVGEVSAGRREGNYLVHSPASRSPELMSAVTDGVGLDRIDDFRLGRATLEDVYLELDHTGPRTVQPAPEPEPPPAPSAPEPRKPARERMRRMGVAFKYLLLEQLLEVRTTWSWNLLLGVLMPAAMVFGLARIGNGLGDATSLLYIVSGAAVFSVATEGIGTLAQRIGMLKKDGMMVYYASLPISKAPFLAALVSARLMLITPGLITPVVVAIALYDADFELSPALLPVLLVTCLALSAIGLAIGTLVSNMDLIVIITNLLVFVLLLAAPVLIPPESLPGPLRVFGYLLPPTYAAEALRHALSGQFDLTFAIDMTVLVAMAALGLTAATRWIRWRVG
jgi:ABC-2 type transport system permease protein